MKKDELTSQSRIQEQEYKEGQDKYFSFQEKKEDTEK